MATSEPNNKTDETPQPETQEPCGDVCGRCGSTMKNQMFRTGSTQHPPKWVSVCPSCGQKK